MKTEGMDYVIVVDIRIFSYNVILYYDIVVATIALYLHGIKEKKQAATSKKWSLKPLLASKLLLVLIAIACKEQWIISYDII